MKCGLDEEGLEEAGLEDEEIEGATGTSSLNSTKLRHREASWPLNLATLLNINLTI
jgi:hypothetical protein